jgi:hypothetical protein
MVQSPMILIISFVQVSSKSSQVTNNHYNYVERNNFQCFVFHTYTYSEKIWQQMEIQITQLSLQVNVAFK